MKLVKNGLALGLMALATMVAPATASALEWVKEGGVPLEEPETLQLEGTIGRSVVGFACGWKGSATISPGNEGAITSVSLIPSTCNGWGAHAGCEATSYESKVPWPLRIEGVFQESAYVKVTNVYLKVNLKGCVNAQTSIILGSEFGLYPKNPGEISQFTIGGLGQSYMSGSGTFLPAGFYGYE